MEEEFDCKCIKIVGHVEAVKWILSPKVYKPSTGPLALGDWKENRHIWLYYVESADGLLRDEDVLRSTGTRYWSIHDVQRYYLGELHCDQALFTYQYPSLKLPSHLGTYLWKANAALKLSPKLYMKELHMSIEETLKKMESKTVQMDRLLVSDQLIKLHRLDYFKRKTFLRILQNIIGCQNNLQLVSFENLCCTRLEGVRLIQQLACFAANTLKYLFLWRFVTPNENPLLINYSYITAMTTDEEKCKIAKLLQDIDVPEIKITESSLGLVKEFQARYNEEIQDEIKENETYENPYIPDRQLLEENETKLKALLAESKRSIKEFKSAKAMLPPGDPKRPWRTNSNKEKLLRINSELKQHQEKSTTLITPLQDNDMKYLIIQCQEETLNAPCVGADKLRETVDEARRSLPNFQYKKIDNSTATAILPEAHVNIATPKNIMK